MGPHLSIFVDDFRSLPTLRYNFFLRYLSTVFYYVNVLCGCNCFVARLVVHSCMKEQQCRILELKLQKYKHETQ